MCKAITPYVEIHLKTDKVKHVKSSPHLFNLVRTLGGGQTKSVALSQPVIANCRKKNWMPLDLDKRNYSILVSKSIKIKMPMVFYNDEDKTSWSEVCPQKPTISIVNPKTP